MADYTYAQLSQMQKEAVQRVQEMRKRARFAAEDAAQRFDENDPPQSTDRPIPPVQCQQPVCTSMPNGLQGVQAQLSQKKDPQTSGCPLCNKARGREQRFLQSLLGGKMSADEKDQALLLSLCFLLKAEQADEDLILALLYLMR